MPALFPLTFSIQYLKPFDLRVRREKKLERENKNWKSWVVGWWGGGGGGGGCLLTYSVAAKYDHLRL